MNNEEQTFKESLLNLIKDLRKQGVDFKEEHPVITISFQEEPDMLIQILLVEYGKDNIKDLRESDGSVH